MLKPILLVEDDPRDLELTLVALERSQLANEVIVVRDGAAGARLPARARASTPSARQGNPAVVLLDLKLPKVDGLEVLQTVRDDRAAAQHPGGDAHLVARGERPGRAATSWASTPTWSSRSSSSSSSTAIADLGMFWAVLNEPPPGSLAARARRHE